MFKKSPAQSEMNQRTLTLILLAFVIALSYCTYFHRYWTPKAVYWDENYHIASAEKYLSGVYFMEQHPPLGKLLIALGEKMINANDRDDQFLGTDYGTDFGNGFSFVGYRFFPALLAWWTAPVLFLIFLLILKNPLQSTLLSFFYIFDNGIIVQTRGAMLEGSLIFFCALMLLLFFLILRDWQKKNRLLLWSVLMGATFGCILTTKLLGLVLILLVLPILWTLYPHWKKMLHFVVCFLVPFVLVYCTVWHIHFALGKTINTNLPDSGYYQASESYKSFLAQGNTDSWLAFPLLLRDSLAYVSHYNNGAPRLDLCKDDENGSPFYFWPLGGRTINFRWETPEGKNYRYLYLIPNPAVWWTAFGAVLLATAMLACSVLCPPKRPLKNRFLLCVFLGIYISFMIAVSRIDRVLYLYHYFIPLLLSFILVALVFDELQTLGRHVLSEHGKTILATLMASLIFACYIIYWPFTYYQPLSDSQFNLRNIFGLWDMHCVNCERNNGLVIPVKK